MSEAPSNRLTLVIARASCDGQCHTPCVRKIESNFGRAAVTAGPALQDGREFFVRVAADRLESRNQWSDVWVDASRDGPKGPLELIDGRQTAQVLTRSLLAGSEGSV